MSDPTAQVEESPKVDPAVQAQIDTMKAEIARLTTNPRNLPTRAHCNGCGADVEQGERCPRHPTEKVNYVRQGLPGEAEMVLVKQN